MRKGLLVVGVVLLVIGIGLAAYSQVGTSSSVSIPPAPGATFLTFNLLTPGTVTVSWSGAASGTLVELVQCTDSSCTNIASVVGNATGSSASFSGTITPGNHYALAVLGTQGVTATVTITGVTYLTVVGIVLAVVGAILAVLSLRRSKNAPPEAPSSGEPVPVEGTAPTEADASGSTATWGGASEASAGTARANLVCGHCGTVNEPWITNCRKCKRPLASTSA